MPRLLIYVFSAIVCPFAVQADCTRMSGNRVANCGFEAGDPPTDWSLTWGEDFMRSPVAASGSFSGSVVPEGWFIPETRIVSLRSSCFPVKQPLDMEFGFSVRRLILGDHGDCTASIRSYAGDECDFDDFIEGVGAPFVLVTGDGWQRSSGSGVVVGPYAQFDIGCESYGALLVEPFLFDDTFAVPEISALEIPTLGRTGLALAMVLLASAALWKIRAARG